MGVAVGTAWAIKRAGLDERVYLYCGDMAAETGSFHEANNYAFNFSLPITFIIGDNGLSVMTDTKKTWNNYPLDKAKWGTWDLKRFFYTNKWPHSGLKERVQF
jgi:pyruvate dehydrogenase E1 component alpha subunit